MTELLKIIISQRREKFQNLYVVVVCLHSKILYRKELLFCTWLYPKASIQRNQLCSAGFEELDDVDCS